MNKVKVSRPNVVIALIASSGLAVTSQMGLAEQLFEAMSLNVAIPPAAAKSNMNLTSNNTYYIQKISTDLIRIDNDKAFMVSKEGEIKPLLDGFYRLPSKEILTLLNGKIVNVTSVSDYLTQSWKEGGTWTNGPDAGPWKEGGWRDGGTWERDASGDSNKRQQPRTTPNVRDTYKQVNPTQTLPGRTVAPISPNVPTKPINPSSPGRPGTVTPIAP